MNNADWAMIPGARNARYGTSPVSMTCSRENVCPKINSHNAGCTMRVSNSLRSCPSFCNSTSPNAPMRRNNPPTRCSPRGARMSSTGTARSTDTAHRRSAGADLAQTAPRGVLREVRTGVVPEHVLERRLGGGLGAEVGLQVAGRANGLQHAVVHERDTVAQRVGF